MTDYIVTLPVSGVWADVAGAPASLIERIVTTIGVPTSGSPSFVPAVSQDRAAAIEADPPNNMVALATDPNIVHINLLRGSIARPSIEQIIHIYGAENLLRSLKALESISE